MKFNPLGAKKLIDAVREALSSSKSRAKKLIEMGAIFVNQQQEKRPFVIVDETMTILFQLRPQQEIAPYSVSPYSIVYVDRDLIVVDKPPHLLTVANEKRSKVNLHQLLKEKFGTKIYVIHRLDRDSSGLLLFARSQKAYEPLKELFTKRTVRRRYIAIHEGTIEQPSGRWESYLQEEKDLSISNHSSFAIGRKLAITNYLLLKREGNLLLMQHLLETGRKHQIRVQSATNGIPIVGDRRYQSPPHRINRLALHAYELSFIHPFLEKQLSFISPLPKIFPQIFRSIDPSLQIAS